MFEIDNIRNMFTNKTKKECIICFNDKYLNTFCKNNHEFCNNCCKEWIKKTYDCPVCKEKCNNLEYVKYYYELYNFDKDEEGATINNLIRYFKLWHKPQCIRNKHKFNIYKNKKSWKITFRCTNCWMEEQFPYLPPDTSE